MDIEGWQMLTGILFVIAFVCFVFFVHISLEVHRLRRKLTEVRTTLRETMMEAHKLRIDLMLKNFDATKLTDDELTEEELDYLHKSLGVKRT